MPHQRSTPASRAANRAAKLERKAELAALRAAPGPATVGPPLSLATIEAWAARTGRESLAASHRTRRESAPGGTPQGSSGPDSPGLVVSGTSDTPPATTPPATQDLPRKRLRRMRRSVLTAARLHVEELQEGGRRYRAAFITVTYGDHAPEPNDVAKLCKHYRQWCARRRVEYRCVWVAENQPRSGKLHYHLVLFLPRGITPPMPDKQGWWPKGSTRCEWARKPVGYLAKYASKGGQDEQWQLPKGARICGSAGLRGTTRDVLRWWLAPQWLRALVTCGDVLRRVGRWWENRTTGIAYRSPYDLVDRFGDTLVCTGPHWDEDRIRFL